MEVNTPVEMWALEESHHRGFWIASYGQTLMEEKTIHEFKQGIPGMGGSLNTVYSYFLSLYGVVCVS
jgi:hypothetical protein